MKLEEEKLTQTGNANVQNKQKKSQQPQYLQRHDDSTTSLNVAQETPLSSTTKSLDLPPKEYEKQLQQYECEVRNHIKVEQQLKLHIEVLQDKIDDIEKEKEASRKQNEIEIANIKEKLQKELERVAKLKDKEIEKLNSENKKLNNKLQEYQNVIEQQKNSQIISSSLQKQNLIQSIKQNLMLNQSVTNSKSNAHHKRSTSQSKSPDFHINQNQQYNNGDNKKIRTSSQGKSPYLNDCFYKLLQGTETSTGAASKRPISSNNSSAKSHRKNGGGSISYNQESNEAVEIQVKKSKQAMGNNSIQENMKIIAAIQRMRQGNQNGLQQMSNPLQQNKQNHKKNKSFTYYGTTGGSTGGRVTQSSLGHSIHYMTSDGSANI